MAGTDKERGWLFHTQPTTLGTTLITRNLNCVFGLGTFFFQMEPLIRGEDQGVGYLAAGNAGADTSSQALF